MVTYTEARTHARACGYVLDGIDAVPIDQVLRRAKSGKGAWTAVDILHPEDQSVVCPAGDWIDAEEINLLASIGVDYVILEN